MHGHMRFVSVLGLCASATVLANTAGCGGSGNGAGPAQTDTDAASSGAHVHATTGSHEHNTTGSHEHDTTGAHEHNTTTSTPQTTGPLATTTGGASDTAVLPTATDSTTGSDTTGEPSPFGPIEEFGDDTLENDLLGVWGLSFGPSWGITALNPVPPPWDPVGAPDSVLSVNAQGGFVWTEYSADCDPAQTTVGMGSVWVEGSQIVFHVDSWERQLPWDTLNGPPAQDFAAPFRMKLGYTLQGSYLTLAGPSTLTEVGPYNGRSLQYIDPEADRNDLAGHWLGEAELVAIPAGQQLPQTIVRTSFQGNFQPDDGVVGSNVEGLVIEQGETTRYFFPDDSVTAVDLIASWWCYNTCPTTSGLAALYPPAGGAGISFTYGPYAATTRLISFDAGLTFVAAGISDCE